ncbi:hypothetical protein HKCCE3408_16045 [Rhodobacterales bacterium HKCCE3408]|nr:hypothetical protein [Rhodobacterales bacterium HKCCE3408]
MFRTLGLMAALLSAAPAAAERINIDLQPITQAIVPQAVLAGDREFGGNGPRMVLETRLVPVRGGTAIEAHVTFRAEETGGDGSFTRISPPPFEVWRSARGERVEFVVGNANARVEWLSGPGCGPIGCAILGPSEDGGRITTQPGMGYIRDITYLGDTMGDDISSDNNPHGDTSIRTIRFHPITVELID